MERLLLPCVLVLISLASACSRTITTQTAQGKKQNADDQQIQAVENLELRNQIEQIAAAAKGRVGVAAVVLETGATVSLNSRDHFPMQSVYKLPISMAVLKQVDAGKVRLEQKVHVTKSDFVRRGQ